MSARRRLGFTLIEMLAVMFLVTVVLTQAVAFYFDITDAGIEAAERTREGRRAASILDRVARDVENAMLVTKPGPVDPLDHAWLFVGESPGEDGARRLRFVTRLEAPRATVSQAADLGIVTYALRESDTGELELWRRLDPGLPERLERRIEPQEDDLLLADGLDTFGVRFLTESGDWKDEWDSTTLADSSRLPRAVEIVVAIASGVEADPFADDPWAARRFARRVAIPMRPIDLAALLDEEGGAGSGERENDESGEETNGCEVRVGDCAQADAGYLRRFGFEPDQLAPDECLDDIIGLNAALGCFE